MNQLKRLEYGIQMEVLDSSSNKILEKNNKVFLVAGIFDKPAKAGVLNMKTSNGFYGCTKCLQPGISYRQNDDGKTLILIVKFLLYLSMNSYIKLEFNTFTLITKITQKGH